MDDLWDGNLPTARKLEVTASLFEEMPSYSYFTFLGTHYGVFSDADLENFWSWMRKLLASEDRAFLNAAGYSLWCDFFEDARRVERAWAEVTREGLPPSALRCVLDHSGPVPYPLKKRLYGVLITDKAWHLPIFRSLLHSAHDAFGQIDKKDARKLLAQLDLPNDTQYLKELRSKINPWWALR
ncbi:MAG: hypothetical protein ACPG31_06050 [Planctomycetota bacterium]